MKIGLKNVVKNITNGLFPPRCRGCGASGEYLCDCCKKYISDNASARSIDLTGFGNEPVFKSAVYLGFRDEILGELIEEAKYNSVRGILLEIAEVVYRSSFLTIKDVVLVPMPTNRKHVRDRGFDHMDLICREIERLSGGRVRRMRLLQRAKDTVQVGATSEVRKKQAKEAVRLSKKEVERFFEGFAGFSVVLIDDVWTTGASLVEAGKLLKEANIYDLSAIAITKNRTHKSPKIRRGELI